MVDITAPMSQVDSTPEEAAQNITGANVFNMSPDTYKDYSPHLQPEIDNLKTPSEASPTVAEYVGQSAQHASVMASTAPPAPDSKDTAAPASDVDKMSTVEKMWNYAADQMTGRRTIAQQISDLNLDKMFNQDSWNDDKELKLYGLNQQASNFSNYGLSTPQQLPGDVLGGLASMGASVGKHAGLIASVTAAGFGAGAVAGIEGGPLGMAAAGVGTGLSAFFKGSTAAMTYDAIGGQIGSTYNDLSNLQKSDGTPMNIDNDTKRNLAVGAGIATGAVVAVVGSTVARELPFMSKFINPKFLQSVVVNPEQEALKATLFAIGKSVAAGDIGGGVQKITEIMAQEFAKSVGNKPLNEAGFLNTLQDVASGLSKRSGEIEHAVTVGGLMAGSVAGIFGGLGYSATKANYVAQDAQAMGRAYETGPDESRALPSPMQPQTSEAPISDIHPSGPVGPSGEPTNPVDKAIGALRVDETLDQVSKVLNSTKMKQVAPDETQKLLRSIVQNAGIQSMYVDKEALQQFSTDATRAADVRNMIDPSGVAAAAINAPIAIQPHQFQPLVDKYPEFTGSLKANPEDPSGDQAKAYLEKHVEAEKQRQQILADLEVADITPEQKAESQARLQALNAATVEPSHDVFGEADYMDDSKLKAAMDKMEVPEAQRDSYLASQKEAKQTVVDNINDTAKYEMNQVRDIAMDQANEATYEQSLQNMVNDPNLQIVDRFTKGPEEFYPTDRYPKGVLSKEQQAGELTLNHAKKGFSLLAIDPRTLPEKLQKYADDPQLKKHKVFVKGGINAEEAARLIGANNAETLLKILKNTPSREDIAQREVQMRKKENQDKVNTSVDLNHTAIAKAYDARLANAVTTLKHLKANNWSDMRGGIRRIALTPPKVQDITAQAQAIVAQTTIGNLKPNQYKVGERKSHRLAVDAILKNDPETAFKQQENVATNIALTKEALLATARVNRVIKLAKRFKDPSVKQELKDAKYLDAANEILDVFNLDPKQKGQSEKGAFLKYVQKAEENGQFVSTIPDRLNDVRKSINEMTVEQVLAVGDVLKSLLHNAKWKNELYAKHNDDTPSAMDLVSHQVHEQLLKNIDYDEKRNITELKSAEGQFKPLVKMFRDMQNLAEIPKYLIGKMDDDKSIGIMHDLLYEGLNKARNHEQSLEIQTQKHLEEIIEKRIGKKEYQRMANSVVTIPEFEKSPGIPGGRMSELELLELAHHMGNEGNLRMVEQTTGIDNLRTMEVMGRYFTHEHWAMVQDHWGTFKSFEPKLAAMHEKTTGLDFKSVKPKPLLVTAKDGTQRVIPGGYYPIHTTTDRGLLMAKQIAGSTEVMKADSKRQQFAAEAMTEQGHTISRVGNSSMLDLNANRMGSSIAQVLHDLTHREAIMDASKVLTDAGIRKDIISVLGHEGYETLGDQLIDSTNSVQKEGYGRAEKFLLPAYNYIGEGVSVLDVGFKLSTLLMHSVALGNVINKIGYVKGMQHLTSVIGNILAHPETWPKLVEWAEDVHPHIMRESEHLEQSTERTLNSLVPTKQTPYISATLAGKRYAVKSAMNGISWVDQKVKVLGILTLLKAGFNGDIKDVNPMDYKAVTKYTSSTVRDLLLHTKTSDKTPLQKTPLAKAITKFSGPAFSFLNQTMREIRISRKGAVGAFNNATGRQGYGNDDGETNFKNAYNYGKMGLGAFAGITFLSAILAQWHKTVHGQPKPFDEKGAFTDPNKFLKNSADFLEQAPGAILGLIPIVRDVQYSLEKFWEKDKTVVMPNDKALNDVAMGLDGLYHLLADHERMNKKQAKGLANTVGVITHTPIDGILKAIGNPDLSEVPTIVKGDMQRLSDQISKFVKNNPDAHPDFVQDLHNIQQQIDPPKSTAKASIPDGALDTIKQIESKGLWYAKNPSSTAAGLYQFTQETWDKIKADAPDLGLTEAGRTAKDPSQQEKAMDYFTKQNIQVLKQGNILVTVENIYAAHFLGADKAVQVLSSPGDTKLKSLVGDQVMAANDLKNSMKVSAFKDWLLSRTSQAEVQLEGRQASIDKTVH